MVLNSLLERQPDGSFSWATENLEVRVYNERASSPEGTFDFSLGWSSFVWPAKQRSPWTSNYLFHTAGRGSKEEAALAAEEFLRKEFPQELPEDPPSALTRLSGEDLF